IDDPPPAVGPALQVLSAIVKGEAGLDEVRLPAEIEVLAEDQLDSRPEKGLGVVCGRGSDVLPGRRRPADDELRSRPEIAHQFRMARIKGRMVVQVTVGHALVLLVDVVISDLEERTLRYRPGPGSVENPVEAFPGDGHVRMVGEPYARIAGFIVVAAEAGDEEMVRGRVRTQLKKQLVRPGLGVRDRAEVIDPSRCRRTGKVG